MEEHDLIASLLTWAHVTFAIAFIVGLVGYYVSFYQAARETEIQAVHGLVRLGKMFQKYFVSPGIDLLFVAGMFAAWREEVPMLGFIQGGDENWLLVAIVLVFSTFPLMFLVFRPREKVFNKELENALAKGEITQGLTAAFADRAYRNWHIYELATTAVIVFLMVVKPF